MAIVSDIEIRLMANVAQLRQDMEQARRSVGSAMDGISRAAGTAAAALGAIGVALSVGAFAGWIKGAIDAADAASDISQRTGIAIKDVAGLQLAFIKGGQEAGDMEGAMIKLSRQIAEGGGAFDKLGIKTKASSGELRTNKEVLYEAADAFAGLQDGTQKTALAVELFGKSGAAMIPLLNEGSEGLREMDEMAAKLGITLDEKTVNAAGDFNDTLDFLALASKGVANQLLAQLLPTLNSVTGSFLEFVTTGDRVRGTAEVIGTAFKGLYTIGVGLFEMFRTVGSVMGGIAAAQVAFATGEYKLAAGILREMASDVTDSWKASAKTVTDVWTGAGGEMVEALVKTQQASTVVTNTVDKDAKKQADAYQTLVNAAQQRVFETSREAAGLDKLTDSQKMALQLDQDLISGKVVLTAAQEGAYRMLIETIAANEQQIKLNKDIEESNKRAAAGAADVAKLQKALNDEAEKAVKTAEDEAKANEELVRTYGMTEAAIAKLAVTRAEDNLERAKTAGLDYDEIQRLERLIVAKKRSAEAIADMDDLKKQRDMWESIEKTAHDTFVSIMDGGKGAAQRLKDTFKNVFFDWLYQQTLKKWIINLSPQAAGGGDGLTSLMSLFSSGASSSGGGGSSAMGNASTLISAGKYLYQGFTQGFSTLFSGGGAAAGAGGMSSLMSGISNIPVIGWIIAGMMANNKFFKQGWDIGGQTGDIAKSLLGSTLKGNPFGVMGATATVGINAGNNALRALGLNDQMASLLSGSSLWARAFGRQKPTIESQGIQGTLSASGLTGEAFANILEKGGWFRSDKRYTKTAALEAETDKAFDDTMLQMVAAVKGFGTTLGAQTNVIDGYNKQIKLTLGSDEEANKKLIDEMFSGVADDLANLLVPNIARFSAEGETAATTLQRLAQNFTALDAMLGVMGTTGPQAFGAIGVASLDARERLIALAGGIESLASQVDFFSANFLTAAERIAPTQKMVTEQLAALGRSGITTTEQFATAVKELAASGALATEEGAKTYAALLALAPAFKAVTDAADQLRAAQVQALRDAASDAVGALQRAVDARKTELAASFDDLMGRLDARIAASNTKISGLQALSSLLSGASFAPTSAAASAMGRAQAQAQIATALAIAKAGGMLPSADSLGAAVAAATTDASSQFGSLADLQRDQLRTQNSIIELGAITDAQLSVEQRTLAALQDQRTLAQMTYAAEVARLDALVTSAQMQLDAINGVNVSVLTVAQALTQFTASVTAALGNSTIGGQSGAGAASIESLYNSVLGRASDAAGLAFWTQALKDGHTLDSIRQEFLRSDEYLGGARGVYSAQGSGTMVSDGSAMLTEMQTMNTRLQNIEQATRQQADQFDSVSAGGGALLTQAA